MSHRIESRPGWSPIVPRILAASDTTIGQCAQEIAMRARNVLAARGYDSIDLSGNSGANASLQRLAEDADDRYLTLLDESGGQADPQVLDAFAIARHLKWTPKLGPGAKVV